MILKHMLTGNIGTFVKNVHGYYGEMTIIKLKDGREYYAPSYEFKKI